MKKYTATMPPKKVDPRATANYKRFMACEDVKISKRRVWAVGRFLRDFKVWATKREGAR
jgi:hypothetical protein